MTYKIKKKLKKNKTKIYCACVKISTKEIYSSKSKKNIKKINTHSNTHAINRLGKKSTTAITKQITLKLNLPFEFLAYIIWIEKYRY